jgi:5-formyltetrahydrofolate cyclo-ligase
MIAEQKQSLRVEARRFLARVDANDQRLRSEKLLLEIGRWKAWAAARSICAFSALPAEPDILNPWPVGKKIILPRVVGSTMALHFVKCIDELVPGSFGILEPPAHLPESEPRADLILVPGLAFDRSGARLGRGGGYYDRLLTKFHGVRVGVCFEEVVFGALPVEDHDVRMDFLVTPSGVIACDPQSRLSGSGESGFPQVPPRRLQP